MQVRELAKVRTPSVVLRWCAAGFAQDDKVGGIHVAIAVEIAGYRRGARADGVVFRGRERAIAAAAEDADVVAVRVCRDDVESHRRG